MTGHELRCAWRMGDDMSTPDLLVRWTIGDVSVEGFEALRLSIWSATRLFGGNARYVICVNSLPLSVARARAGDMPPNVEWRNVTTEMWPEIEPHLDGRLAEGVAWKFAPLRIHPDGYELALDNDCILWSIPSALSAWLASSDTCLIAEDVRPCFGKFASVCGKAPRNSGIRGLPPRFDIGHAMLETLRDHPVTLTSELDEQGLQVAAISRYAPPHVVTVDDVSICSPFPPHRPEFGRCGAHFVGLNARSLPWELNGRPAVMHIREHWQRQRAALYERVGIEPRPPRRRTA